MYSEVIFRNMPKNTKRGHEQMTLEKPDSSVKNRAKPLVYTITNIDSKCNRLEYRI